MIKHVQIGINDATEIQRRLFAKDYLSLEGIDGMSDDTLLSTIVACNGGSEMIFIAVEQDPAPTAQQESATQAKVGPLVDPFRDPATPPSGGMAGSLGHDDPKVELIIHAENRNGETYNRDVEVGVNGRVWQIKRGVKATVPYRVYLAILDAVQTNYTHENVGNDVIEVASDAPRVTVQPSVLPSKQEIADWHARIDNHELA